MRNTAIEVCLISARGLRKTSSLLRPQWFAVGWIDPKDKYCTKVSASGNSIPVWNTKFSAMVDDPAGEKAEDLALHVEVYSREPLFLRERLEGEATVRLREFLDRYAQNSEGVCQVAEELVSFQLRKPKSGKPQGFVDISIQISKQRDAPSSPLGTGDGFQLRNLGSQFSSAAAAGQVQLGHPGSKQSEHFRPERHLPYPHHTPFPQYYTNPSAAGPSSYHPVQHLLSPPAPSITFDPRMGQFPHQSYVNMPTSGGSKLGGPVAQFGMGMGAGALAAGAVIYGDDIMSGVNPTYGAQDASLTIAADTPF
uniref:C2 domain-containing protein n=1 Tax=Kalanchoe fedtschenkoi TaxID=63787 RepID=A0A7N0UGM6_KALFE